MCVCVGGGGLPSELSADYVVCEKSFAKGIMLFVRRSLFST